MKQGLWVWVRVKNEYVIMQLLVWNLDSSYLA
jgi:hypothetical protein